LHYCHSTQVHHDTSPDYTSALPRRLIHNLLSPWAIINSISTVLSLRCGDGSTGRLRLRRRNVIPTAEAVLPGQHPLGKWRLPPWGGGHLEVKTLAWTNLQYPIRWIAVTSHRWSRSRIFLDVTRVEDRIVDGWADYIELA